MLSFDFKTGDVGEFLASFKSLDKAQQLTIISSGKFNAAQTKLLKNAAGMTAATTGQAAATGTLAVAEGEAAAATGGLSAMMVGLSATMSKLWTTVLAPILSNPLTWAIAIGAAAVAFYSSTNILPFQ